MVNRQVDAVAELQKAFEVLTKNWVLAVPTGVAALIATAFFLFVVAATLASFAGAGMMGGYHPNRTAALLGVGGLTLVIGIIAVVLVFMLAHATVMAAAENAWQGRPVDIGAGVATALSKLPALIVLFLIIVVVGIVCALLIIALGLGIVLGAVLGFLWMYALPAIVIGNQGAVEALGTSYRLVRANFAPSVTAFVGIIVVTIIGEVIVRVFHFIPALSIIIAFVVGGLTYAYAALVTVRFYDLLRSQAAPAMPASGIAP